MKGFPRFICHRVPPSSTLVDTGRTVPRGSRQAVAGLPVSVRVEPVRAARREGRLRLGRRAEVRAADVPDHRRRIAESNRARAARRIERGKREAVTQRGTTR